MNLIERFLEYTFLQNALLGGLIVAVLGGVLGVFLVLRGMSLLGDGLAHLSFAGIALGLVAGVLPLEMAFVVSVGGAVVIYVLREKQVVKGDTAIGIIFTTGLALGILLISYSRSLVNVQSYLFGTLVAVTRHDLATTAMLGGGLLLLLAVFYREFVYMTFSEEAARVSGLPVRFLNLLFMTMTAATIVMAARLSGVLLVSALIIVPAASALQLRRGFRATLALSVAFGVTSVLVGLGLSVQYDLAPGATIALTNIAFFLATSVARSLFMRPPPVVHEGHVHVGGHVHPPHRAE
jgi:zinc transport system permease protein